MAVSSYQNLPVVADEPWDPRSQGRTAIEREILGEGDEPNWVRFKKAHLWYDPDNQTVKSGYKLLIARMHEGTLKVNLRQLSAAVAVLNGARGGINISRSEKRKAYTHAMKYYKKAGVEKKDRPEFTGSSRPGLSTSKFALGKCVALEITDVGEDEGRPTWVQVAREGDFPGYCYGTQPFAFTKQHFNQAILNLRNHPSYVLGDDGVGAADVIPWDFGHASEWDPTIGTLPVSGAPAQAWTRDFRMDVGDDGNAKLMALTRFMEPALTYVREGRYAWASVACLFEAVHPETAEEVGALITSIALTNQPFIEGMDRLAASKFGAQPQTNSRAYYWDAASDSSEAFSMFKDLLGLSEMSGAAQVAAELTKLGEFVEADADVPLGVDVEYLVSSIRKILGLPALSTDQEVVSGGLAVITKLVDEAAAAQTVPAAGATTTPSATAEEKAAMARREEADMELLKTLASKLGVRELDDTVLAAVVDLIDMRSGIVDALGVDRENAKGVVERILSTKKDADNFGNLLSALGVSNESEATQRVVTLTESSEELKKVMPELEKLRESVKAQEDAQAEADVSAVLSARGYSDDLKEPMLLFRRTDPKGFAEKYPKEAEAAKHAQLTRTIAADSKGAQHDVSSGKASLPSGDVTDLALYPGRNITERAMACVRSTIPGADKWKHDDVFVAACRFKDSDNVIDSTAS